MAKIQSIRETLCSLDCGSCGAPTCQAMAEDIVNGEASIDDCVMNMKNKFMAMTNANAAADEQHNEK